MSRSVLAASVTVLAGVTAFVVVDLLSPEERVVTFDSDQENIGALTTINGVLFLRSKGQVIITEPLANLRLPLRRTLLGKELVIRPRFHLDEGDILEVGVKKTSFWLDYDRQPLVHRPLDYLLVRDDHTWSALRSLDRIVFLNPRFGNPWKSVEEFERQPPTDGTIGLYGNSKLAPAVSADVPMSLASFSVSDNPDDFRAIYAWYPPPDRSDPEWTENEQRFDLGSAFQNADRSIDIMFFVQRRPSTTSGTGQPAGGAADAPENPPEGSRAPRAALRRDDGPIRVLLDEVTFRIEPGWPSLGELSAFLRRNLARLIRRPAPSASAG